MGAAGEVPEALPDAEAVGRRVNPAAHPHGWAFCYTPLKGHPVNNAAERFAECKAIAEHSEPLSRDERIAFASSIARVKAEDDRRRGQPSPQMELPA